VSEAEKAALYGLPDFDEFQRLEYFAFSPEEHALVQSRAGLPEQLVCILQIAFFKAKRAFFQFLLADVAKEDIDFVMQRFFPDRVLHRRKVSKREYYLQHREILQLFGYRSWSGKFLLPLFETATQQARLDVTPSFVLTELIAALKREKIVRPGYNTLQRIISQALAKERERLGHLVNRALNKKANATLKQLLKSEGSLSEEPVSDLTIVQRDAKNFRYAAMTLERQKRALLAPLYRAAKELLPKLDISQRNIEYYASLATFYTIYDLRHLKPEQTKLYLLCYVWQRYRIFSDNLVDALDYQMKQLEEETKASAVQQFAKARIGQQQESPKVGQLLLLYVDPKLKDGTPFGHVRRRAFKILSKEDVATIGQRYCEKPVSQIEWRWREVDKVAPRFIKNVRPLAMELDLSSQTTPSPWLNALKWMKKVFEKQQSLERRPLWEIPKNTVPKRLRPYLLELDSQGEPVRLRGDRYEFWIYRQVRKHLTVGELYLDDSVRRRRFSDELVSIERKEEVLKGLDIPWLRQPADKTLDELFEKLHQLWSNFDCELRNGKLTHLEYDPAQKKLTWRKPEVEKEEESDFYVKLPQHDVADVFRLVNERCDFLSQLTPLQPRYAKNVADEDTLMAVILAQALNHGNWSMSQTSDISYSALETAHQQYLRLATLKAANDRISSFIAGLAIFPYYSFDLEVLYGSVDGQKFESADPTIKARHSRKYFGKGKGVVAYTLLANHVALQTELIGAHEHESYYLFDICYHNTSGIVPTRVTGDQHVINKVNFALTHWFGMDLAPRFANLQPQLKHLYCGEKLKEYQNYLIQPAGRIDRDLIVSEKANIDRIVATLGLKEMSQSILVRKLCSLSPLNSTRKAIFEFDKLIRSMYTLRYLRDPSCSAMSTVPRTASRSIINSERLSRRLPEKSICRAKTIWRWRSAMNAGDCWRT